MNFWAEYARNILPSWTPDEWDWLRFLVIVSLGFLILWFVAWRSSKCRIHNKELRRINRGNMSPYDAEVIDWICDDCEAERH
jgi:hypothetical protein